jgi:hypothetical protein
MNFHPLSFEFDPAKAAANLKKHRVSFDEAITVSPIHSGPPFTTRLIRWMSNASLSSGSPPAAASSSSFTLNQTPARASLAHASPPRLSENNMKKSAKPDPLAPRPNLDFSKGVRGKYTNLLAKGTNVAIIDPTLHPYFPDSEAVNRALRAFLAINHQVQEAGTRIRRRPAASAKPEFAPRVGVQPRQASR